VRTKRTMRIKSPQSSPLTYKRGKVLEPALACPGGIWILRPRRQAGRWLFEPRPSGEFCMALSRMSKMQIDSLSSRIIFGRHFLECLPMRAGGGRGWGFPRGLPKTSALKSPKGAKTGCGKMRVCRRKQPSEAKQAAAKFGTGQERRSLRAKESA
jgi:hypothetical protein